MNKAPAIVAFAALAILPVKSFAQNKFPSPDGQSIVEGVQTMCTNSSGQSVPWWSAAGVWQCAGGVNTAISISGGFTDAVTGTPISVTTGGVTGTLPAGTVVIATNVGATNGAYCKLGASATTSDQYLSPGGGWFAFQVGAATHLTCITSTSTTTVNMTGGAGLPTGTGGGGGGGGGGGAVTIASSAVASGAYSSGSIASGAIASGAIASGAYASGSIGSGAIASGAVASGAIASGAAVSGSFVDGAIATLGTKADSAYTGTGSATQIAIGKGIYAALTNDPCFAQTHTISPINIATTGTVRIVTGNTGQHVYVCGLALSPTGGAINVALVSGATSCSSPTGIMGGSTAATGLGMANTGNVLSFAGPGGGAFAVSAATGDDVCLITSTNTQLSGSVISVLQ